MDVNHKLKVSDPDFTGLLEDYDAVNDEIHLAETKVKPVDQPMEVELRKRLLRIKHEIAAACPGEVHVAPCRL